MRDLMVYVEAMEVELFHYRDSVSLEADAIIEGLDGRWAGTEVESGHSEVDEGARSLLSVRQKLLGAGCAFPAVPTVIEGLGNYVYVREGVYVIPICTSGI